MPMFVVPRNFVGTGFPAANLAPYDGTDPDYPTANLYDGRTSPVTLWTAGDVHASAGVRIPLNQLQDGDFEDGVTGWGVVEGADIERDVTDPHGGTYALLLHFGETGLQPLRQTFIAYASHYYRLRVATRSPLGGTVKVALLDLEYGSSATVAGMRFLTSAGAWTDTESYIGETMADAWTYSSVTFQAPSFQSWGRTSGRMMVMLIGDGDALFDDVEVVPGVDVAAIVGHDFPSIATLGLYSGPDIDLDPLVVSAAPQQPVAFVRASALVYATEVAVAPRWPTGRYAFRVPWMGELYVGQSVELRVPRINMQTDREEEQVRLAGRGHPSSYRWASYPARSPVLTFDFESADQRNKALEQWMLATDMGARPHLILPSTLAQPEACYFGTVEPKFGDTHPHMDLPYFSTEVRFTEAQIARFEAPYTVPTFV